MEDSSSCAILNNGVKIPWIGFGTYKAEGGDSCIEAVKEALNIGYRHIDTASFYGNEESVGFGIKQSGVPRKNIFLVSKVWNSDQGYEKTLQAFENSIKNLGTDYLDMYLIHWPQRLSTETWRAMEKLHIEGRVRSIGVSNFNVKHLISLMENTNIKPAINQVEFHPQLVQDDLMEFCKKNSIQLEAWSPLMRGKVFQIPLFHELSKKYGKTISQIVLRWDLQMGVVTIPKSTTRERIKENINIFDFEISKDDMVEIEKLNIGLRMGMDPDKVYEGSIIES